ncbi:hypothetical protein ACH4YO_31365 [Streptomyces noursei]|uniref:hypothetical protein n=1 Tax=Streptomyces noursei TaxID=1971 RepID=UPI0033DEA77E
MEKRLDVDDVVESLLRDVQVMYPGEIDRTAGSGPGDPGDDHALHDGTSETLRRSPAGVTCPSRTP